MRIGIDCRALHNTSRYLGIGMYTLNFVQALSQANGHHQLIPFGGNSFLRQRRKYRMDLCHVLEFLPPFPEVGRAVVTVYDLIPLIFPKIYLRWRSVRTRWNLRSYFRFLKKVRQIIAISHHTKADLTRLLEIPEERIRVIYPGVSSVFRPCDNRQTLPSVLARYGIQPPFVLYVGSCDYRKNIPGLMRAFARFRVGKFREFRLVLAGYLTKANRKALQQQGAALGLGHSLHLLGYVPLEDLVALYNAAMMLVFPSFYEGFGFPVLEAMACGTPVIASSTASLPEVTDGSALLVNPYDNDSVVDGMQQMAGDRSLRETLVQKGLVRAQQFTWARAAQETFALYEEIGSP